MDSQDTRLNGPSFSTPGSEGEINERFGPYRTPTTVTLPRFKAIQEKTLELAEMIDNFCPESDEKENALDQLVLAKMSANASIAIHLTN